MDLFHKVTNWIDHNRGVFTMVIVGIVVSVGIVGCQPTTTSLLNPERKVTVAELDREVIILDQQFSKRASIITTLRDEFNFAVLSKNAEISMAEEDLERKYEARAELINIVGGVAATIASGATLSPPAIVSTVLSVVGLFAVGGLGYDNVKKGRKIKEQKTALNSTTSS